MNYLTALLAFAAIMIVLTTLATVVVEGLHKILRQRAAGFEELLEQLFKEGVEPRLEKAGLTALESVDDWVGEMVRNPAFGSKRPPAGAKLPLVGKLISNLKDTAFQELSTRQFIEQFGQTKAGKKLSNKGQDEVTELLGKFAYEFERYGEAASTYFKRRATTLSLIVAVVLAVGFNIDAFRLYGALAADQSLSKQVLATVDVKKIEAQYLKRLEAAGDDEDASIQKEYDKILESIEQSSQQLTDLGLPIGTAYFPYCAGSSQTAGGQPIDARCATITADTSSEFEWPLIGGLVTETVRNFHRVRLRVFGSKAGWTWLFHVLVAGGLIGLGAPFWFQTFRTLANFIPGVKHDAKTLERQEPKKRLTQQEATALVTANQVVADATPSAEPSGDQKTGADDQIAAEPTGKKPPGKAFSLADDETRAHGKASGQRPSTETTPPAGKTQVHVVPGTAAVVPPTAQVQVVVKSGLSRSDLYDIFANSHRGSD